MDINLNKIPEHIFKIQDCDLAEDFIAIGIELDDNGIGHHSGIFISLNNELVLFHFDGSVVKIENANDLNQWFLLNKLVIFEGEDDFIINFKAHCEIICEEATPEFGFLFDGSYYDINGKYYTETEINDVTTCVGFCIKVIQGYLNSSNYIDLTGWNIDSLDDYKLKNNQFYEYQLDLLKEKYPSRIDEIKDKYFKRILPSELTSAGFCDTLPITKQNTDYLKPTVEMVLQTKRLS